jgi:hypothetical protein
MMQDVLCQGSKHATEPQMTAQRGDSPKRLT